MDTSILIENLKANVDAMAWLQAQTILRDKYKENAKRWRQNNPEKHREYRNLKNKEYYQRNKAVLNKKRVEYYHLKNNARHWLTKRHWWLGI